MSKLLAGAKLVRERSDYADFVIISKEEALKQIQSAKKFVEETEKVLKDYIKRKHSFFVDYISSNDFKRIGKNMKYL